VKALLLPSDLLFSQVLDRIKYTLYFVLDLIDPLLEAKPHLERQLINFVDAASDLMRQHDQGILKGVQLIH